MGKVKLENVAKFAGVSPTTVSRVLNNRGYISDATRKKVNDAIEELGYFPNEVARSLYGSKTNLIGILFPNVSNPFYGEMVTEIEKNLSQKGYKTLLCNTSDNEEKETEHLKMLLSNQVDGIVVGSRNQPSDIYEKANLAVVAIDRFVSAKVPIVRSDNYGGACLATRYLLTKKCKKIAIFIGSPEEEIKKGDLRLKGYLDTLTENNHGEHICRVSFDENENYQKAKISEYMDANPDIDGVFATGDILAGMIKSIARQKNKNPEIVGYDGSDTFLSLCGDISTVRQPVKKMARLSVDILLDSLAGNYEHEGQEYILPVTLIERSV
ncbi:MAG: LacI family transcriptional regulator [Oscillospiraceae bacterium]|nr:LacI family transcriptional regulator [Oscillospiraceae bacterium]MCL2279424.1 LacI family transcriptional regulator [Oscillospiraceae bacterium]